jgi:hypothetical protein
MIYFDDIHPLIIHLLSSAPLLVSCQVVPFYNYVIIIIIIILGKYVIAKALLYNTTLGIQISIDEFSKTRLVHNSYMVPGSLLRMRAL